MKKYILLSLNILLMSLIANAQYSTVVRGLTNEEQFEANKEIITNAPIIIDGRKLDCITKSLVKKGEIDRAFLIKLTHVLRSDDLKAEDTIIVVIRNIAYGTDTMYEPYLPNGYPTLFSQNLTDRSINCELFLNKNGNEIIMNDNFWQNKMVYELYKTKNGYASVYLNDDAILDTKYVVYALFNLKFKTRQEWYNYLKQYDNIKVPEGY